MSIHSLIPLVAAVIYVSLFLVIIINRPWQQQHKLLAWYLVAASFWTLSSFFLFHSDFFVEYKLLLFRIVVFTSMWWAVQLYYFVRSFLSLPGGWATRFGYISLVAFGAIVTMGYAPPAIIFIDGLANPVYGWWFIVYVVPLIILAGMGVYSLVQRLRIVTDPRERNRFGYLMVAIVLLASFGFVSITPLGRGYPLAHIGALFSACILTYAVMKHELVSINSVLRRGLGWTSLFVVGIGSYVLIFYLLSLLVNFELKFITLALAVLAAAVVAILVYWLRTTFLGMIDQFFWGGTYSYRQVLLSFDREMGNIISLDELADKMLSTIVGALRTTQAKLLFQNIDSGDFTTQFTYLKVEDQSSDELRFVPNNPVIAWLEKENSPLNLKQVDSITQFMGLWQIEKDILATSSLELLCPIKSRGKLIGILALGRKQSDTPYSQDDIEMIISMASKAGIIIENARMFDLLKKQQLQVQQLLSEAIHAQESERQRISVDLHDSVAQWLAGASYQAQAIETLLLGDNSEKAQDELTTVEDTIDKSLKELRRVLVDLRPPALDELGLNHALRESLENLASDGLICNFREEGTQIRLPPSVEITVYRMVQEALTNIRKHANATRVDLSLQFQDDKLLVEIRDNGAGFDLAHTVDNAISVGNLGLLGMKHRAEMLGGGLEIKTSKGAGTTIIMSLPVQPPLEES